MEASTSQRAQDRLDAGGQRPVSRAGQAHDLLRIGGLLGKGQIRDDTPDS